MFLVVLGGVCGLCSCLRCGLNWTRVSCQPQGGGGINEEAGWKRLVSGFLSVSFLILLFDGARWGINHEL